MNLPNIPGGFRPVIIGRGPNPGAIKVLEDALELAKKGELVSVALVGERASDGEIVMSFAVDGANGEAVKLLGGLGLVAAKLEKKLLGG